MKAHIVGGGFGALAAAVLLIKNAEVSGKDITIYEADGELGGGFFLAGNLENGYHVPGSVFDREYRCTLEMLKWIPTAKNPAISVSKDFSDFNEKEPYHDNAHIIGRDGHIEHSPRFGLSLWDGFRITRLLLTPEGWMEGKRIDEYFPESFFSTEFWFLWASIMGTLPKHSAIEFRRYMNRFLYLFAHLYDMNGVYRTSFNQRQYFIEPLLAWLRPKGVNFITGAVVKDIVFAPSPDRITVNRLDYERGGAATSVAVAPDDLVLVTTGSQHADLAPGTTSTAPNTRITGRSWKLWEQLAKGRKGFGNPDVFFAQKCIPDSRWITFTVTEKGTQFRDLLCALTKSKPGRGGLVTLKDSNWVLSLSIFHQPEVNGQPGGTTVWWGYGLHPERKGNFVKKIMTECTGAEVLEETLRHLKFDKQMAAIIAASNCIPCDIPYVNNIWLPRNADDRPPPVPKGSTNLGLIGQYVEMPKEIAFTIECSVRSAWEVIYTLLKRGPAPPPVYQGLFDLKALWGALKVFICG
jgi:oleate hydratase